jgi:hypothetical protein
LFATAFTDRAGVSKHGPRNQNISRTDNYTAFPRLAGSKGLDGAAQPNDQSYYYGRGQDSLPVPTETGGEKNAKREESKKKTVARIRQDT